MHVEVITPEAQVFSGEATSVTLPGTDGSLGILNNHAPLITTLRAGVVIVKTGNGNDQEIQVNGGTVEVLNNRLTILAE